MDEATFELCDVETGNVAGFIATEAESLRVVRLLLDSFGRAYADDLTLVRRDEDGSSGVVAIGDQLRELVDTRTEERAVVETSSGLD